MLQGKTALVTGSGVVIHEPAGATMHIAEGVDGFARRTR